MSFGIQGIRSTRLYATEGFKEYGTEEFKEYVTEGFKGWRLNNRASLFRETEASDGAAEDESSSLWERTIQKSFAIIHQRKQ